MVSFEREYYCVDSIYRRGIRHAWLVIGITQNLQVQTVGSCFYKAQTIDVRDRIVTCDERSLFRLWKFPLQE